MKYSWRDVFSIAWLVVFLLGAFGVAIPSSNIILGLLSIFVIAAIIARV